MSDIMQHMLGIIERVDELHGEVDFILRKVGNTGVITERDEQFVRNIDRALDQIEPRVLTLEEVKGMKRLAVCAVEQRSKVIKNTFNAEYGGIVTIDNENFLDFGLYGDTNRYRRAEPGYGKTWRCWSSRPTDAQREAAPWEKAES